MKPKYRRRRPSKGMEGLLPSMSVFTTVMAPLVGSPLTRFLTVMTACGWEMVARAR